MTGDGDVQYNINEGNYEQYGMTWTIGAGALTKNEVSAFSDKIFEMNNNKYVNYKKSSEGEYIFSVDNKLIYSDADYDNPTISKVITFNTDNENLIDYARECFYEGELIGRRFEESKEIAGAVLGEETVTQSNYGDYESYKNIENNGRKGINGSKANTGSGEDVNYSMENLTPEQVEEINKIEQSGEKVSRFTKNIFLQI